MVEGGARGLDLTGPLPRANGEQLARSVGRKVRLVVKVRAEGASDSGSAARFLDWRSLSKSQ